MVRGFCAGARLLRKRRSYTPPVAGATAAVTGPLPGEGRVGEPDRIPTVAPTSEPLPVTRKSPAFHFAVAMVMRSTVLFGLSTPERADGSLEPALFSACTVNV